MIWRIISWWEEAPAWQATLVFVAFIVGIVALLVFVLVSIFPSPKPHCENGGRALYVYETCGKTMCYRFAGCEVP